MNCQIAAAKLHAEQITAAQDPNEAFVTLKRVREVKDEMGLRPPEAPPGPGPATAAGSEDGASSSDEDAHSYIKVIPIESSNDRSSNDKDIK